MMSTPPWNYIGWIVLIVLCCWLFAVVSSVALLAFVHLKEPAAQLWRLFRWRLLYYRTRHRVPRVGQVWREWLYRGWEELTIKEVTAAGEVYLGSGFRMGWCLPDQWRDRILTQGLHLYKEAPPPGEDEE